jgi:hypothetical protein
VKSHDAIRDTAGQDRQVADITMRISQERLLRYSRAEGPAEPRCFTSRCLSLRIVPADRRLRSRSPVAKAMFFGAHILPSIDSGAGPESIAEVDHGGRSRSQSFREKPGL